MITILRQYFTYKIIDAYTLKIALDITMKVEEQPFILLPIKNYRADLRVVDSEGNDLIILSDKEFESISGTKMSEITEAYIAKLKTDLSNKYFDLMKEYRVVAVMLHRESGSYYEKIKVSWTEKFAISRPDGDLSDYIDIPIYIPRYGFEHGATSAIYLSVKTAPKYVISHEPKIIDLLTGEQPELRPIMNNKRHVLYRFTETPNAQLIELRVQVGLPSAIRTWAGLGLISGISIPVYLLLLTAFFRIIPKFALETLVAEIGFLAGLRVLVFRDTTLMDRWNMIFYGLIVIVGIVFAVLMLFSYYIPSVP